VRSGQEQTKRIDSSNGGPVLVIGSGLHAAAGVQHLTWPAIIRAAFPRARALPNFDEAVALGWEAYLIDKASKRAGKAPADVESKALSALSTTVDKKYPVGAAGPLYDQLRTSKIADLIVFNIDRTLHVPNEPWKAPRQGPPLGSTRVWHPHGHSGEPAAIIFGTRKYGMELEDLERERERYWPRARRSDSSAHPDPQ
jgi:hypothetical protein